MMRASARGGGGFTCAAPRPPSDAKTRGGRDLGSGKGPGCIENLQRGWAPDDAETHAGGGGILVVAEVFAVRKIGSEGRILVAARILVARKLMSVMKGSW
jgi:hypothetical protein